MARDMAGSPREYALVLNAGSSSLKFAVYRGAHPAAWDLDARGQIGGIGRIGASTGLVVKDEAGAVLADTALPGGVADGAAAVEHVLRWIADRYRGSRVLGVGHRVVHGGAAFGAPCIVTPEVLAGLRALVPLAPLHQPHNLDVIDAVAERMPEVPQVACFDTTFHRGWSEVAALVPLPREIRDTGVRRYGFHGLSYEYIASVLPAVAPTIAGGRVIVAHLGNGASLCALNAGRSVDTTLGFSALDGLCMGTRPGSIDPGVILHLFQAMGRSAAEVEAILYERSGLLGISGISNDMRALVGNDAPPARLAVDYFVYQAAKHIGALAAVLGGLDGLVFTAGIGEHSAEIRRRICAASAWLGLEIDPAANDAHAVRISVPDSRVSAWVVPTDEERMIARHMQSVLGTAERRP